MLQGALYCSRDFLCLRLSDSNYKHSSEEECGRAEEINKILEIFYSVTCIFSRSKYPIANLYSTTCSWFTNIGEGYVALVDVIFD